MSQKKSIMRVAAAAVTQDTKARAKDAKDKASQSTIDSFVNFGMKMGIGTDNPLSGGTYGFNPITRNRTLLEWIHRGSWIGGIAVDVVADDMTRAGVSVKSQMKPDQIETLEEAATSLKIWESIGDTIRWDRLYGGAIAVMLIDGQDPATPLRINTIRKGQFRGLLVLDRWMVEPTLNDLITNLGPDLGLPKYYRVTAQAPALSRQTIHHSRCIRMEGLKLPYWQRVMENLWGISILERLYDRLIAFDSASTGAAQLVYKAYIRTYKIKDLRQIIAGGGAPMNGLTAYVDMMRRFQGIEGMTLLDAEDEFEANSHTAFSGLSDVLLQFGQQLSGALGIPLVRMFGQSPAGLNATGESDLIMYYDSIKQQQERKLLVPVTNIYRCLAASEGIIIPEGFKLDFNPLWQLSDEKKAEVSSTTVDSVTKAKDAGLISDQVALKELRQSSKITGIFSNITDEDIEAAETEPPPSAEELLAQGAEGSVSESESGKGTKEKVSVKEKVDGEQGEAVKAEGEASATKKNSKDQIPTAAGVLFKCREKMLILHRSFGDTRAGYWALPGGHIENGETPEEAANRECVEEIGRDASGKTNKPGVLIGNNGNFLTYLQIVENEFAPVLNTEHDGYKWVLLNEAEKLQLHPELRKLLAQK